MSPCLFLVTDIHSAAFLTYLPIPLVVLTSPNGVQTINISPVAFTVASAEFPDQIDVWQNALPGPLKGKLQSVGLPLVLNGSELMTFSWMELKLY